MEKLMDRLFVLLIGGLMLGVIGAGLMAPKPTQTLILGTLSIPNDRVPAVVGRF